MTTAVHDDTVTSAGAAELLGVARGTVRRWCRAGYLRAARRDAGGAWQIPRASVARVAEAERIMDAVPDVAGPLPWRA